MASSFPLNPVNGVQTIPVPGGSVGFHQLYLAFGTAPSAGTVSIEIRRIGSAIWRPVQKATAVSITSGELAVRVDSSVAGIRVTFAGLVGGVAPGLWLMSQDVPADAFNGFAAMIIQNYTEANVKNGVQYEFSGDNLALANLGTIDTIFTTGANPVVIKGRTVKFNGSHLTTRVYRAPTYTGGAIAPYFNLNDRNPVSGSATIRTGAAVSAPGTEFGAPTFDVGSVGQGNSSLSTFSVFGIERLLAPNTAYLQRITNDSGATQEVSSYLTWYDGGVDFPL